MNRIILGLALCIAVFLGVRFFSTHPQVPTDHPKLLQSVRPEVNVLASTAPVTPAFRPEPAPTVSQLPRSAQKPQGNIVDFKIIDGLAIAFGDVILGKPDSSSHVAQGSYEAPIPQTWDRGIVPYAINPDLPNPKRVEAAISYFMNHTSVKFVPYEGQHDAIVFEPGSEHCFSALGKTGGLQPIKLAAGCQSQEIMHEIMHALGFVHEQSRIDRDQYVEILWQNVDPDYQIQFAMVPESFMDAEKDSPFDYHSIMLYSPTSFAIKPGLNTMQSKGSEAISPQNTGLSEGDIRRIERVYGIGGGTENIGE